MFVDILNNFQSIHFFMESPIWVTIVIFAVIGFFRKLLTASITMGFEQAIEESDKGVPGDAIASSITFLIGAFIVAVINVIYIFPLVTCHSRF